MMIKNNNGDEDDDDNAASCDDDIMRIRQTTRKSALKAFKFISYSLFVAHLHIFLISSSFLVPSLSAFSSLIFLPETDKTNT